MCIRDRVAVLVQDGGSERREQLETLHGLERGSLVRDVAVHGLDRLVDVLGGRPGGGCVVRRQPPGGLVEELHELLGLWRVPAFGPVTGRDETLDLVHRTLRMFDTSAVTS